MLVRFTDNNSNLIEIKVRTINTNLNKVIQDYSFIHISEKTENINNRVIQSIKESKLFIINYCTFNDQNYGFFIIGMKKALIIINQSLISNLQPFFDDPNKNIYIFQNAKIIFNKYIKVKNKQIDIDPVFLEEISNFNSKIIINQISGPRINEIETIFSSCISGYLIKESYDKIGIKSFMSHINSFFGSNNQISMREFEEEDFIMIRRINQGTVSNIELIYGIKEEELYVVKKPSNPEITYSIEREYNNYLSIKDPFIPKLYGRIKGTKYPVIQFINGKTLNNIQQFHFSIKDKIIIIYEMIMIIDRIHLESFVYRDLKPDNVMIDGNKNVFIIDFDRMIKRNNFDEHYQDYTNDFQTVFVAPEVNFGQITCENDVYSIGQMIYYIMNEKIPSFENENSLDIDLFDHNEKLFSLYKRCTDLEIKNRPIINEILFELYILYSSQINESEIHNLYSIHFFNALINITDDLINDDVDIAFNLYLYAANQNYSFAQFIIGLFYYEGKYIQKDLKKAIYYFKLAAEQDNLNAECFLGEIYYMNHNIEKSLYYLKLAANKNHIDSQFKIGFIYSSIDQVRDINKAIHYYTLAADQNDMKSQSNLAAIYYEGKYIQKDLKKAFHYFTLASNQNEPISKFYIGEFYYNGQIIQKDIEKAIFYYTQSANENIVMAQHSLGLLYYEGKYIKQDIEKAIYYLTSAANQNDAPSQFILCKIYRDIKIDIKKSADYLTLSALNNYAPAQCYYAYSLYHNPNVQQYIDVIIYLFNLAANKNDSIAQFYLGLIFYENKYIKRDIDKSIYYFKLAAKQNNVESQFNLGIIYYEGKYIVRDIYQSIHYFTLASDQGNLISQYYLGRIFFENKYIKRNIDKSIHYLTLSADKDCVQSQNFLGFIYYLEKDNIKAIYYFTLAAKHKFRLSQFFLGMIYLENFIDINKSIYYLTLSANQNYHKAQFYLGYLYLLNFGVSKNMVKALDLFLRASSNSNIYSHFIVGYFYHEGKYIEKDMSKSIHYYKEGSSFNDQYAKNNLGIIYKYGFGDKIHKNIGLSIEYFKDAINQKNDQISMYNLAHIFIYEDQSKDSLNEAINLLIKFIYNFNEYENIYFNNISFYLLCIALIKKNGFDIEKIKKEVLIKTDSDLEITYFICQMIEKHELNKETIFDDIYKNLKEIDFIYNYYKKAIIAKSLNTQNFVHIDVNNGKVLTEDFYVGFGNDI